MKLIFLIWPQRAMLLTSFIHIPGHGFSENWLPDLLLDVKRLRRENRRKSFEKHLKAPKNHQKQG